MCNRAKQVSAAAACIGLMMTSLVSGEPPAERAGAVQVVQAARHAPASVADYEAMLAVNWAKATPYYGRMLLLSAAASRDDVRAVEIVLETRRGSVSLLQRRLAIGYTRSSRLIDLMGIAGIISDHKGSVARDVLITPEDWAMMKQLAQEEAKAKGLEWPPRAPGEQQALFVEPKAELPEAEPREAEPPESEPPESERERAEGPAVVMPTTSEPAAVEVSSEEDVAPWEEENEE